MVMLMRCLKLHFDFQAIFSCIDCIFAVYSFCDWTPSTVIMIIIWFVFLVQNRNTPCRLHSERSGKTTDWFMTIWVDKLGTWLSLTRTKYGNRIFSSQTKRKATFMILLCQMSSFESSLTEVSFTLYESHLSWPVQWTWNTIHSTSKPVTSKWHRVSILSHTILSVLADRGRIAKIEKCNVGNEEEKRNKWGNPFKNGGYVCVLRDSKWEERVRWNSLYVLSSLPLSFQVLILYKNTNMLSFRFLPYLLSIHHCSNSAVNLASIARIVLFWHFLSIFRPVLSV